MESFQVWKFPEFCNPNGASSHLSVTFSQAYTLVDDEDNIDNIALQTKIKKYCLMKNNYSVESYVKQIVSKS